MSFQTVSMRMGEVVLKGNINNFLGTARLVVWKGMLLNFPGTRPFSF